VLKRGVDRLNDGAAHGFLAEVGLFSSPSMR
jgi:hypothetical protein